MVVLVCLLERKDLYFQEVVVQEHLPPLEEMVEEGPLDVVVGAVVLV
jgi:hypothetical protein